MLPRKSGRLSLYAVTGGSLVKNDYVALPHDYRWGRDVAELNLTPTLTLPNWYNRVTENNIPFKYETMYTSYRSFFPTSDAEKENTVQKKRWLEYWFAEGKNPIIRDAFPVLDGTEVKYYNRFNISHFFKSDGTSGTDDNWYERFRKTTSRSGWDDGELDQNKNAAAALEVLTQAAVAYRECHSVDAEVDPSGLPFLRRIGNNPWSFDSLEHLRKQIAANFNDYCDADSIPTSNVKASEWDIAGTAALPSYTGNEKTLYINEVAAQIGKIWVHYQKSNYALEVTNDLDVKMLVELVNMYDNSDASPLLDPANLALKFKLEGLSFKIALHGKYTGRITYKDKDGKSKNVTVNDTNAIEVNKNYVYRDSNYERHIFRQL